MDPPRIAGDPAPSGPRYRFGDVVVDERAHTVLRAGESLALEPKTFAVLLVLLRHPGELLERDQLLDTVWGHRHVTPGVLTRAIAQLRHALGDDPHRPRYIQTQHALGYRFIGQLLDCDETLAHTDPQATDGAVPDASSRPLRPESAPLPEADAEPARPNAQAPHPLPPTPAAVDPRATASANASPVVGQGSGPGSPVGAGPGPRMEPPRGSGRGHAMRLTALALLALLLVLVLAWRGCSTPEHTGRALAGDSPSDWVAQRAADPGSIAVLPFTSLSTDRDDAYFAQGLAEEIHDSLAGVPGLQVAAGPAEDDAASGPLNLKTMGVATVLEASVRREGRRFRIHARLIDTGTGYTLWSDRYDRETDDAFALQTEIANEVVQALLGVLRAAQPDIGPGDADGIACNLAPDRGRVYVDVDYAANTMPLATPAQCEVERGSTITWRGPTDEAAEFRVIFVDDSPHGPRGDRVLVSESEGGREKITMTAGNAPGSYRYDIESDGRRVDQAIIIRKARGARQGPE